MRLESFRIKNCFGFWDSGEIDLSGPGNLVYFLGRNSSGKTSLLRAISYFERGKLPQQQPNFQNYEQLQGAKYLQARFSVDASEERQLSADTLITEVIQRFGNTPLQIVQGEEGFSVTPETYGTSQAATLMDHLYEVYTSLTGKIHEEGQVWIDKNADGSYEFLSEQDNYGDLEARRDSLNSLIRALNSAFAASGQGHSVALDFNQLEELLFMQFPEIFFFTDRFSLDENLPRSLSAEHLPKPFPNREDTLLIGCTGTPCLSDSPERFGGIG